MEWISIQIQKPKHHTLCTVSTIFQVLTTVQPRIKIFRDVTRKHYYTGTDVSEQITVSIFRAVKQSLILPTAMQKPRNIQLTYPHFLYILYRLLNAAYLNWTTQNILRNDLTLLPICTARYYRKTERYVYFFAWILGDKWWYWPTNVGTWGSAARSWLFSYSQFHFYMTAVKHLKVSQHMSMQATCNTFQKNWNFVY